MQLARRQSPSPTRAMRTSPTNKGTATIAKGLSGEQFPASPFICCEAALYLLRSSPFYLLRNSPFYLLRSSPFCFWPHCTHESELPGALCASPGPKNRIICANDVE